VIRYLLDTDVFSQFTNPNRHPNVATWLATVDDSELSVSAPVFTPSQHDPGEAFFRSREDFSLVHLCNHWTAELLSAAGLPTTPVLDTLPAGLRLDLRLRAGL
jgi:hypothetical protein